MQSRTKSERKGQGLDIRGQGQGRRFRGQVLDIQGKVVGPEVKDFKHTTEQKWTQLRITSDNLTGQVMIGNEITFELIVFAKIFIHVYC